MLGWVKEEFFPFYRQGNKKISWFSNSWLKHRLACHPSKQYCTGKSYPNQTLTIPSEHLVSKHSQDWVMLWLKSELCHPNTMEDTLQIDSGCSTAPSNNNSTNCTHTELQQVRLITFWPSRTHIHSVAVDIWWLCTWVGRTYSHSVPIEWRGNVVPRDSEGLTWVIELHSRLGRKQWVCERREYQISRLWLIAC